jgi:hypothetical protein
VKQGDVLCYTSDSFNITKVAWQKGYFTAVYQSHWDNDQQWENGQENKANHQKPDAILKCNSKIMGVDRLNQISNMSI